MREIEWFGPSNQTFEFQMFSISHFFMLAILLIVGFVIFLKRVALHNHIWRKAEIGLAVYLILFEVTYHLWMLGNGLWIAGRSLPLELCNIGLILCVILLLTRSRLAYELLSFIAILGATQAILTPALTYGFPHFRFFHFFLAHMMLVWVTLYFTWAQGYRPTLYSVLKLIVFLNLLLPLILFVNNTANGNYWFLRHKPDGPSLYDVLGPYPWYIFSMEALLVLLSLIVWLLFRVNPKKQSNSSRVQGL